MATQVSMRMISGFLLLLVLIAGASCKKDSPNPVGPGPGGGGGGSVSDSLRSVVLDSLVSKINQLPQIDRNADNQTIYQYVRSLSAFSASGVRSSGVWARFQDGRVWAYVNNLEGTDTSWSRQPSTIQGTFSSRGLLSPTEDLPQSNTARVMNGLGPKFDYSGSDQVGFTQAATNIRSWLQDAGYTPSSSAMTIQELKSVSGDGVFYYSTHGDTVPMPDGSYSLGLWTATQRTPADDALYQADLDAGRLWYFSAPHSRTTGFFSKDVSEIHYAITHEFVRTYMSFGPRSVVFINACKSGHEQFRDACIAKGADLYLGWSNYAESHRAVRVAQFFFDRALGANAETPVLSPPQKGYQLYDVLGFMNSTGRDFTVHPDHGRADLLHYPIAPDVTMLRPLIYYVSPSSTELRIGGWFGSDPGQGGATVTVGGDLVPIRTWQSESTIICEPVQHGGDVVVSVRGRKSKPVPLTKFNGTFIYTVQGRGSLVRHMYLTIEFLADVRTNRIQVDQTPAWEGPRNVYALATTGGTFDASGEYRNLPDTTLIESWAGGGSIAAMVSGSIDRSGLTPTSIYVASNSTYLRNGTVTPFSILPTVGILQSQITDAYEIPGATYTGGGGSETHTGEFLTFTPTFAPTSQTVR